MSVWDQDIVLRDNVPMNAITPSFPRPAPQWRPPTATCSRLAPCHGLDHDALSGWVKGHSADPTMTL